MSTENVGRVAREWVAAIYKQTGLCGGLFESEAEANRSGNTNYENVHVREVLPGEPAGSAMTFEEWAKDRRAWDCSAGEVHFFDAYGIHRSVDDDRARAIWNAAREGMVPAGEAAPALEQWVSVDERLPDFAGPVLACRKSNSPTVYYRYDKTTKFSSDVTHWMPLPPPPAEPLSPFKRWWLSLPTHAGSDPDTFRIIADECVHVNTAIAVWSECEGVRGGGK